MKRCVLCGKAVKIVQVFGSEGYAISDYFVHKVKNHGCTEKLTHNMVHNVSIPKQHHCKLCWKKVNRGEQTSEFTWVHAEPHSCKEVLQNHEAVVPLKLIVTSDGVWKDVNLVKLPLPKKARTMVLKVEAPVYGKEFRVHENQHISGKKVFVIRACGQIPRTCHPTLASAINNIKYRIWRYESKSGYWKYLREPAPVNPGGFKI